MSTVNLCEHRFADEDPDHPGFSMLEVDLPVRVDASDELNRSMKEHQLSIRKNIERDRFEIYEIGHSAAYEQNDDGVRYPAPNLEEIVAKANELEEDAVGRRGLGVGCGGLGCSKDVSK